MPAVSKPTGLAILLGAGPTTGSGIARILASPSHGNLAVALLSRTASPSLATSLSASSHGGVLHAFQSDTSSTSLKRAFEQIRAHDAFAGLPLKLAIWNVKHSHKVPFEDETSDRFDDSLRVYVGGARNFAAECTAWMLSQNQSHPQGELSTHAQGEEKGALEKKGTLIFTGTLGALRTNAQYAAYGAGRAGVRMLAQSLAREYSARGIHVVHAIANGGIVDVSDERSEEDAEGTEAGTEGTEGTESKSKGEAKGTEAGSKGNEQAVLAGTRIRAESVGKTYLWLSRQEVDLWVHELDMRPAAEKF